MRFPLHALEPVEEYVLDLRVIDSSLPRRVTPQSPGSRSAPWERERTRVSNPERVAQAAKSEVLCNPFGVEFPFCSYPRVRCATLSCGVQPLRGRKGSASAG